MVSSFMLKQNKKLHDENKCLKKEVNDLKNEVNDDLKKENEGMKDDITMARYFLNADLFELSIQASFKLELV